MQKKSQLSSIVNVSVKEIDKITHKVYNEVRGSNRATRNALYGIIKFLNGEFNPSINDYINSVNKFIPRFVALGKGTGLVNVNDTSLSNEFLVNDLPYRIKINDSEVVNNRNNPYMKLITKTYISDDYFDNNEFTELGLFSTEKSQSCWAHVILEHPFRKSDTTVLEITWEISIISPSGEDTYKMDYVKTVPGETEEQDVSYSLYIDGSRDENGITKHDLIYTKHDYSGVPIGDPQVLDIDIDDNGVLKINDITIVGGE